MGLFIDSDSIPELVAYRRYMCKQRKWWWRFLRSVSGRRALIHRDIEDNMRVNAEIACINAVMNAGKKLLEDEAAG